MGKLLYIVLGIVIVVMLFKMNWIYGLIALGVLLAIVIYLLIPTFYITKGNTAYNNNDFKGAKKWYKKAIDTKRTSIKTKVTYTRILLKTGDNDEAEKVLDNILRYSGIKPADKNLAKQQRCMVYYRQNRLDEAYDDATEIFEEGYKNSLMYGMIGFFKLLRNDPIDETLDFCLEAYDYDDENRDILDNLSICYYRKGDYEKADEISKRVMELNPKFVEAYYHGAQIALKCGDFKYAKECIDKIPSCTRSEMTTVSEEEIEKLSKEINAGLK